MPGENTCQEGNGPMSDLFHFVGQVNIKVRMLSSGQPPFLIPTDLQHICQSLKKKVQHSTTTSDPPLPQKIGPLMVLQRWFLHLRPDSSSSSQLLLSSGFGKEHCDKKG